MSSVIEVQVGDHRARYVLETFLTTIGYPYRIVGSWSKSTLRLACSRTERTNADINVPLRPPPDAFQVSYVDGHPIVIGVDEQPPETGWKNGTANFDLVQFPFELLSRKAEKPVEDDTFPRHRSLLYDLNLGRQPILNDYVQSLQGAIEQQLATNGSSLPRAPRWPDGCTFGVVLTHDVDVISARGLSQAWRDFKTAVTSHDLSRRDRFKSLLLALEQVRFTLTTYGGTDPAWNFETWLDIESEHDFKSTFFVAAVSNHRMQDPTYTLDTELTFEGERQSAAQVFRKLMDRGWEIGLHGSIGTHESETALAEERSRLEAALDDTIAGIRQHHLKFDYPTTWRHHESVGFQFDSTLGFNQRLGHRGGLAFPFRPFDCVAGRRMDIHELPISLQDNVPLLFEYAGRDRALDRCQRVIDEIAETGGLVTLLWHPYTRHHPRWPEPIEVYKELLDTISTRNAYVGTASEIVKWWHEREQWVRGERESLPQASSTRD